MSATLTRISLLSGFLAGGLPPECSPGPGGIKKGALGPLVSLRGEWVAG